MNTEGVIKFNCNWIQSGPLDISVVHKINACRDKLYRQNLIGVNSDGIGFGNISIRHNKNSFIISGSGTGAIPQLTNEHYTTVTTYNIAENSLTAIGPIIASSESLTHAIIYELDPTANAVIHIHNIVLWEYLLKQFPSTDAKVTYGTQEMAQEVKRLFAEKNLSQIKIFAMGGHEEGVIAFGKDCDEAYTIVSNALKLAQSSE